MKTIRALVVALLSAAPAFAVPYHGTFTETITSSDTPVYQVGTKYYGQYWYDSPTADGTFYAPTYGNTLSGKIFLPYVDKNGNAIGGWSSFDTHDIGMLEVANGQVVSFEWALDSNHYYMHAGFSTFAALSFYDDPIYHPETGTWDWPPPVVSGTISFDTPPQVPDVASTGWLLAISLAGLVAWTMRKPARAVRP